MFCVIFFVVFLHSCEFACSDDAMLQKSAVVKVPSNRLVIRFKLPPLPSALIEHLEKKANVSGHKRDLLLLQLVFDGPINKVGFDAFISARDILDVQDTGKQRSGLIESTLGENAEWTRLFDLLNKNVQVLISEKAQAGDADYEVRYMSSGRLKSSAEITLLQPVATVNVALRTRGADAAGPDSDANQA